MRINYDNLIVIIFLLAILYYYAQKNVEKFELDETVPDYYPIDYTKTIYGDFMGSTINNKSLSQLEQILFEAREVANEDQLGVDVFNRPGLPVLKSMLTPEKVKPITDYLIDLINGLGNDINTVKLNNAYNIIEEQTETEAKISMDLNLAYYVKNNPTFFIKKSQMVPDKLYKIDDVIVHVEFFSLKELIDDIFANQQKCDRLYVNQLFIKGHSHQAFLPGSNIVKPLTHELLTKDDQMFTNKEIDEILRQTKNTHLQEMDGRTAQPETAPKLTKHFDEYVVGTM